MESRPTSQESVEALPGLPDHEVLKELGRGGMGVVYLATNKVMGRNEVLKVVNPQMLTEPGAMDRFLQEIRSAAQLSHPNIVTAHAVLRSGESLVLAMEHIVGENLYKVVGERGPLPIPNACYYIHQVAMGLQHAFEKGMVHRDIKPDNLMLAREGKKHLVKILDFGLAKATREKDQSQHNLTGAGQMMGTPDYIAPEQILDAAKADIRADIYSLGCTLYFLLTGSPPFKGGSLYEKLQAHMSMKPISVHKLRDEVPLDLAKIVDKMMAKDVKDRFQKPAEVAQALMPFVKGVKPLAAPEGEADATGKTTTVTGAGGKSKGDGNTVAPTKTPKTKTDAAPKKTMVETDAPDGSKLKPKGKPTETKPAAAKGKWFLVVGGGLGFAAVCVSLLCLVGLWAGGVFRVRTAEGTIVLENLPDDADVFVDGNRLTVKMPGPGGLLEIRTEAGSRKLEIRQGGTKIFSEDVALDAGGKTPVRIRLEPLAKAAPIAENIDKKQPPVVKPDPDVKQPDEKPPPAASDGFVSLFNGKDLTGWYVENGDARQWSIEGGAIVARGLNFNTRNYLLHKKEFADFILRFDFMMDPRSGSGVALRAKENEKMPAGKGAGSGFFDHPMVKIADPAKFTIDPLGTTHWVKDKNTNCRPMADPSLPTGAWHSAEITMRGDALSVILGGKKVVDLRLDSPPGDGFIPALGRAKGKLGFQAHTGTVRYRNVEIKELPPTTVQPPTELAPKGGGFVSLFNGKDKAGWRTHPTQPGNWRVANGVLVGSGPSPVSHLYTERGDYKDFHLIVEARVNDLGGTGVYFRNNFGPAHPPKQPKWLIGYNAKIDKNRLGGLIVDDGKNVALTRSFIPFVPAFQWLTLEVIAEGNHIVLKVDGKTTADYTDDLRRFTKGHISLQQHGPQTVAEFRRIEIKELSPTPVEPPITVKPPVEPGPKEDPFLPLFNGKDLAGWKTPPGQTENWRVENGILMGPGKKASYLYSERSDFKNFHLRAEARVNDGSTGGIYFRVPEIAEKRPQIKGYKVLLNSNELDLNKAGSLFSGFSTDLKPVRESPVVPGEWFTLDVFALNNQTVVKINGKTVTDYTDEKQNFRTGHIALEQADSQTALDFRKIEFRVLAPDAKITMLDPGAGPMPDPGPKSDPKLGPGPGSGGKKTNVNLKGVLKTTDPLDFNDQGKIRGRFKVHPLQMDAGKTYVISLNSTAFDAYLRLQNPLGKTIAEDDDSGGGLNARITFRCTETGVYRIIATSFNGKIGPYQLIVQESP